MLLCVCVWFVYHCVCVPGPKAGLAYQQSKRLRAMKGWSEGDVL